MNRNVPAALALLTALSVIGWLAWVSLSGRDDRAPSVPARGTTPVEGIVRTSPPAPPTPLATASQVGVEREHAADTEGFELTGVVRSSDGHALEAADVVAWLAVEGELELPLGDARTDADGAYRIAGSAPLALEPERRARARLRVVASFDGLRNATALEPLAAEGRAQAIDLALESGGRLAGRVLDAAGVPVRGAEVSLVVTGSVPGQDELSAARTTRTDAAGRFELGFLSGGTVAVHARASGVGSALVADTTLVAGEDLELGDVALAGPGTLAGEVRYADGSPARGLELWAVPAELAGHAHALAVAQRGLLARERGEGLTLDRARTDADGRFRVAGLADGRYAFVTGKKEQTLSSPDATYATGDESVRLELAARRLRVIVRGTEGELLSGAKVAVTPLADEPGARAGRAQHAVADAEGACDFEVPAEVSLALRVSAPDRHTALERVELRRDENERVHEVALHPATTSGTLRVEVTDERGEPFAGLRAYVLAESTGLPVPGFDPAVPVDGVVGPLAPGRYGLVVWPERGTGDEPGDAFPVEAEAPITIAPDAETLVTLVARSGGRVRLTLEVPPGRELPVDPDEASYGQLTRRRRDARRLREHGGTATLAREDGEPRAVHFRHEMGLEMLILPGSTATVDDLLEPGRWTMRIEAPGFEPAEVEVTVEPGLVTDATVRLVPE